LIRVSILGATGYSGGELIRRLLNHPSVVLKHLTSESSANQPLTAVHPDLRGRISLPLEALNIKKIAADSDVVFACYPAGVGIKPIEFFIKSGLTVIDLSADFRLPDADLYKTWYHGKHTAPKLLKKAIYGLPELFKKKIAASKLVANPGCYATAATLAAAPLLKQKLIDPFSLIVDAKSGVSGAGKKVASQYMFCEVQDNLKAYNVASHRHQPEIENVLKQATGVTTKLTFSPHLIPMPRGILSVLYATLKKSMKTAELRQRFADFYANEPFVRVLPLGELPETKNVTYTNNCDIGITQDARLNRVIVLSALDNLVKGAAGQAIQNMNLCFHRPETEGLA
jgi:N-acetyl-gamma-glutamyl-phosphate reductase